MKTKHLTFEKAGKTLLIANPKRGRKTSGSGKVVCARNGKPHRLPCECGGPIVHCTCKLKDKQCGICGRVWVETWDAEFKIRDWYEVVDPHGVCIHCGCSVKASKEGNVCDKCYSKYTPGMMADLEG